MITRKAGPPGLALALPTRPMTPNLPSRQIGALAPWSRAILQPGVFVIDVLRRPDLALQRIGLLKNG